MASELVRKSCKNEFKKEDLTNRNTHLRSHDQVICRCQLLSVVRSNAFQSRRGGVRAFNRLPYCLIVRWLGDRYLRKCGSKFLAWSFGKFYCLAFALIGADS